MGYIRTHTAVHKDRSTDPSGVVQPFLGCVGNEGVDFNWDLGPVSSPVNMLSHCGKFNKDQDC